MRLKNKFARILVILPIFCLMGLLPMKTGKQSTKSLISNDKPVLKPFNFTLERKYPNTRIARTTENGVDLVYPVFIFNNEPDIQAAQISPPHKTQLLPIENSHEYSFVTVKSNNIDSTNIYIK